MPEQHRYKYTKSEVDSVDLTRNSNKVLVKITKPNTERKTESGIIMVAATDTDFNPSQHSDRFGIIHKVPPTLLFDGSPFSMSWDTDVEVREGDEVWFDYLNSENCIVFECDDGFEYKLLDYENLYVVKRDDNLIPLNGYCLFSDHKIKATSQFDPNDGKVDKRYGYVEHVAVPNAAYQTRMFSDHIDLEVGDKVMFGPRAHHYHIEEERYMTLDKMYRPVQRRNVIAVMEGDEIVRLAKNTVLVKPLKESKLPSGIIVPVFRQDVQHFKAEVYMSNHELVEAGQWVLCPKRAPLSYIEDGEELYLLTEEDIWYVWKE